MFTLDCGRNCLGPEQLLRLREIDSEDAVTTGYPGVPKIILIIGLQMDSDGKWTISVHEARKCAVIIAAPSLAHSFCRKENPASENQLDRLEAFSLRASHQGDVKQNPSGSRFASPQ